MTTSYRLRLALNVLFWPAFYALATIFDRSGWLGILWLAWYVFAAVSYLGIVGAVIMALELPRAKLIKQPRLRREGKR